MANLHPNLKKMIATPRSDVTPLWRLRAKVAREAFCEAFLSGDDSTLSMAASELRALLQESPIDTPAVLERRLRERDAKRLRNGFFSPAAIARRKDYYRKRKELRT